MIVELFAETGGKKIYYEIRGSGEPVILLNGAMASTSSWSFQLPALLSHNYKVILMDFAGQGKSDKPRTRYQMEQHVDEVQAVLDSSGVEKANVIGVSYGGEVAMLCGINITSRIRSLVISNSVSYIDRALRAMADRWLLASRFHSGRILWQCVYPDLYSAGYLERNWDFVSRTAPSFDLLDFDALAEMLKAFMQLDITDHLHEISLDTLVLTSDQDATKPQRYSKIIHDEIANSSLKVISGAGHLAMWEKPDEYNKTLLEFIERVRL